MNRALIVWVHAGSSVQRILFLKHGPSACGSPDSFIDAPPPNTRMDLTAIFQRTELFNPQGTQLREGGVLSVDVDARVLFVSTSGNDFGTNSAPELFPKV